MPIPFYIFLNQSRQQTLAFYKKLDFSFYTPDQPKSLVPEHAHAIYQDMNFSLKMICMLL